MIGAEALTLGGFTGLTQNVRSQMEFHITYVDGLRRIEETSLQTDSQETLRPYRRRPARCRPV